MAITKARIESTGRWRRVHDAAFRPRVGYGTVGAWCAYTGPGTPAWPVHQPDLPLTSRRATVGRRCDRGSAQGIGASPPSKPTMVNSALEFVPRMTGVR
jgi:hypothetical protein